MFLNPGFSIISMHRDTNCRKIKICTQRGSKANGWFLHIHPEPNVVRRSWGISGWSPLWPYLLFAVFFKADPREPIGVVAANQEPRLACPSCESVKPKGSQEGLAASTFARAHLFCCFALCCAAVFSGVPRGSCSRIPRNSQRSFSSRHRP